MFCLQVIKCQDITNMWSCKQYGKLINLKTATNDVTAKG